MGVASYSLQHAVEEAIRAFREKYGRAPIYECVNIVGGYSTSKVMLTFTETTE